MKLHKLIIPVITLLLLGSCARKKNAVIVRDCTGTYLQRMGNDYKVCNTEVLESLETGAEIDAKYKLISSCSADTGVVCMLYHKYESWIRVLEVD